MSGATPAARRVRVKVCCIRDRAEARLAVAHGADALGLVSEMPSGPGVIDEATIRDVAAAAPPGVASFLLTCQKPGAIVEQVRRTGVGVVQICDRIDADAWPTLRAALPGVKLVQVVHVTGPESMAEAETAARAADALLLDSGNPKLAVKELGGTGRRHDWAVSARIVASVGVPVYLAGGLRAENAAEAIATVRPFALDICSGVRVDGALDAARLGAFMDAVRRASVPA